MPVTGICLVALLVFGQAGPAAKADPREQLPTAIAEAIRLLEAKQHVEFVKMFVPPERLKERAGTPESLAKFAEAFAQRGARMLAALKEIQKMKPQMDQGDTIATYTLSPQEGAPPSLRFQKIGKFWYIAN